MGFKRISPNLWVRLRSGRAVGFGAFVIAFGIAGTIITAISSTQTTLPWQFLIMAAIFCLIIGVGAAYIRGQMKLIPDSFVDEICSDGHYRCVPCSTEALREACEMTKPYYGREYVSGDVAEQWRMKNPKAFMQILNSDGEICAAFGVMALKDSFMDQFVAGRVCDGQLAEDSISNLEESQKSPRIYLSGVVVRNPSTYSGSKRARIMMWAILVYLKKFYGLRRQRTLFAIAVTKESERLMTNLNFQLISDGKQRVDRCNMYRYNLTKESWEGLLERIGDFSMMVNCDF